MPNCFATGQDKARSKLGSGRHLLEPLFCIAGSLDCSSVTCIRVRRCLGSPHNLPLRARHSDAHQSVIFICTIGMFTTHSRIALVIGLVARVSGHAYVDKVMIGGTSYSGWLPFKCVLSRCSGLITEMIYSDPYESPVPSRIVRKVPNDGPILDWSSADMACNKGGEEPAGATATVQAGRTVQFMWNRVS